MLTLVAVVHIIVAVILVGLVLIQDSKDGAAGGLMGGGGGSNSLLGATGGATLAAKATRWAGLIFAITCIALTYLTSRHTGSVVDGLPAAPAAAEQPVAPVDATAPPVDVTTPVAPPAGSDTK